MSRKNTDARGRLRSVTVGFRMSPEEAERLDFLVGMSGLTKQDYIIKSLTDREATVVPSSRVQRFLSDETKRVYYELRRIGRASEMDEWLKERISLLEDRFLSMGCVLGDEDTARSKIRGIRR